MSENIVKKTAKDLGLTYKQLGEAIGYTESAIKTAIATDKVSEPMQKAIELYLETVALKKEIETTRAFKKHLQDFLI